MAQRGRLTQWDDERGFGFITPNGRTDRLFVHISAFNTSTRPQRGDEVQFRVGSGRDGKPAATHARVVGVFATPPKPAAAPDYFDRHATRVWAACLIIVLVFANLILDRAPFWLALVYCSMGAISFALYWWDKRAARVRAWRMPEKSLHALDMAFGVIGGLLAQQVLRHKTSKSASARLTSVIVACHVGGLLLGVFGVLSLPGGVQ